ncbi:hypothetical protein [Bacillus andreraoultii]|uniref:hypothetical protein n=1 Tax=Bacillus andreraoultii TaxID=1499685 RepID=UPI00067F581C
MKLGKGRTEEEKQLIGDAVFDQIQSHFQELFEKRYLAHYRWKSMNSKQNHRNEIIFINDISKKVRSVVHENEYDSKL